MVSLEMNLKKGYKGYIINRSLFRYKDQKRSVGYSRYPLSTLIFEYPQSLHNFFAFSLLYKITCRGGSK